MGQLDRDMNAVLIVPQGGAPIQKPFIDFLWEKYLGAYLADLAWASPPSDKSSKTSLGLRISPGSC